MARKSNQYPIDSDFIVKASSAKMPNGCWGRYENVALLEVDQGLTSVSMISERAVGCRSIVDYHGKLHSGRTARSASGRAYAELSALASELNRAQARRRKAAATRAARRTAAHEIEIAGQGDAIALAT